MKTKNNFHNTISSQRYSLTELNVPPLINNSTNGYKIIKISDIYKNMYLMKQEKF